MRLIPLYKLKIRFRGCGETFCTCVLFTLCELVIAFGSAVVKCPKCCYSSKSCSNARGYHCTLLHFDQGCKITWTVCFSRLFLREYRVTSVLQKRNFFYAKKINEASQILLKDLKTREVITVIHPTFEVAKIKSEKIQALFSERLSCVHNLWWSLMSLKVFFFVY